MNSARAKEKFNRSKEKKNHDNLPKFRKVFDKIQHTLYFLFNKYALSVCSLNSTEDARMKKILVPTQLTFQWRETVNK